jgi:hypothetical protein
MVTDCRKGKTDSGGPAVASGRGGVENRSWFDRHCAANSAVEAPGSGRVVVDSDWSVVGSDLGAGMLGMAMAGSGLAVDVSPPEATVGDEPVDHWAPKSAEFHCTPLSEWSKGRLVAVPLIPVRPRVDADSESSTDWVRR